MASIPLLCNICPKQPDFSDISHLLTHVASKGHLAQELKAKVRGRQDASVREKLDAYDRWYEKHQIEKLLSQRLILKESKEASSSRVQRSRNSPSVGSSQNLKPRKRRAKSSNKVPEASPVKSEEPLIDPQLSWCPPSSPSSVLGLSGHDGLQQHEQAFNQRYHVPRMCEEQDTSANRRAAVIATPSKMPSGQRCLHDPDPNVDSDTDYFNTFIRSPTMTAYPDPSELAGLPLCFSPPRTTGQAGELANQTPKSTGWNAEKAEAIQPPVLKGVRWPGMSIFDSASLEAQRLRNQKKDGSILEQMEYNSIVVEQMERIYWPDGSLKQERLITGNVESSPLKEPTPPPKRKRAKVKKTVLKDVSTNAPKSTRRAIKSQGPLRDKQASDLRNLSKKALATLDPPLSQFIYPRSAHIGFDAANDEELERRLTSGRFSHDRRQAFDVFNDAVAVDASEGASRINQAKPSAKTADRPFFENAHSHRGGLSQSQTTSVPARRTPFVSSKPPGGNQIRDEPNGLPWDGQHWSSANDSKSPTAEEDSENIEPILDGDGRVDDQVSQAHNHRVTQRYFSVTGNQPPQFFDALPPHMDFGGLAEPRYRGATLNLLNPYLHQHHPSPRYAPVLFHNPAPSTSFFASRQEDIGKSEKPAMAKNRGSNEPNGL